MKIKVTEGGGLLGTYIDHEADIEELGELWDQFVQKTGFTKITKGTTLQNLESKYTNKMSHYSKVEAGDRIMIDYLGGDDHKYEGFDFTTIPSFVREVLKLKKLQE